MKWRAIIEPLIRMGMPGHRLYVGRERHDGRFEIITSPLTLKTLEPYSALSPTDAILDEDMFGGNDDVRSFLQAMSDAAWEIGIKPKQIEDHSSELKATKYHLEDMRHLALGAAREVPPE